MAMDMGSNIPETLALGETGTAVWCMVNMFALALVASYFQGCFSSSMKAGSFLEVARAALMGRLLAPTGQQVVFLTASLLFPQDSVVIMATMKF